MAGARQTIALAGVGDLGRYVCEELLADDRFDLVVLSRQKSNKWLADRKIDVRVSDYSEDSVLSILNASNATTLVSFIYAPAELNVEIHSALLQACIKSQACKRFIPSEFGGNLDDHPDLPRFYASGREPFRQILRATKGIEWTLFNNGWLMDYFIPHEKSYIRPVDEFPVNPRSWEACIQGTGDEPQSWTLAREIGKAVVELLAAPKWETITYVVGQWGSFNEAVKTMESFYGRPLSKSHRSSDDTERFVDLDEWMLSGGTACPREKTLRQRAEYFNNIHFSTLEEVLRRAETTDFL